MSGLQALGQQLRADLERHAEPDRLSAARLRRQVLGQHQSASGRRPWRVAALVGVGALACALGLLLWPRAAQQPLRFWVEERAGVVDAWITAREVEQSLRFSDGSSVVASPGTTTRVMQVLPEGARLTLERGQLDAHVVRREASRWQVAAGPFVVRVTGTRFRVTWEPQTETLAVSVSEGHVEVTGGGHPKHELAAGSGLSLHVAGAASLKSALDIADGPGAAVSAQPGLGATPSARDEDELIRPRKGVEQRLDWRELSTSGHYREALASVEQQGFGAACEGLPARDLLTLGSTARLAGRMDRAREAYLAARRRFPSSSEAAISAFSLGRLASDAGQAGVAIDWFKRYLVEQPGGQLAREASGRLIEHYRQTGSRAQARSASEQYLKQYPTGPHAALARSVLAQP